MAEYIKKEHFDARVREAVGMVEYDLTSDYKDGVLTTLEMLKDEEKADVIEREKINKAIDKITKLRDSCNRMITEEVSVANECYEQYANCYDECLKIITKTI